MKSFREPSISAAIMMEKPTPVMTPATATSVCRAKSDMGPGDGEDQVHGADILVACTRTCRRFTIFAVAGEATVFALLQACYDLDVAGAANADLEVSQ
jgi:hypothetical protein